MVPDLCLGTLKIMRQLIGIIDLDYFTVECGGRGSINQKSELNCYIQAVEHRSACKVVEYI
jgi:hypothetical protein